MHDDETAGGASARVISVLLPGTRRDGSLLRAPLIAIRCLRCAVCCITGERGAKTRMPNSAGYVLRVPRIYVFKQTPRKDVGWRGTLRNVTKRLLSVRVVTESVVRGRIRPYGYALGRSRGGVVRFYILIAVLV